MMPSQDILAEIWANHHRATSARWAAMPRTEKRLLRLKWFVAVCDSDEPGGYMAESGQYPCMEGFRQRGLVTVAETDHKHGRRLITLTDKGRIRFQELADLLGRASR